MKVLVIKQPWAELIASGRKTIELRTWTTRYRGPLLILAAASRSRDADSAAWKHVEGPLACSVAVAELADVTTATLADAHASCCDDPRGHFSWRLSSVRRVAQIPTKGRLGLYAPDERLAALFARG